VAVLTKKLKHEARGPHAELQGEVIYSQQLTGEHLKITVFIGFVFPSTFSLKSLYSPTERWTAVSVVLLYTRRRRSISIETETAVIHVWAT